MNRTRTIAMCAALLLVALDVQAQDTEETDAEETEGSPAVIEELDESPPYVAPDPYDDADRSIVDIVFWILGGVGSTIVIGLLVFKGIKRLKKVKNPGADKQQCPACKKPTDRFEFSPLPRIAVPRRVINFGGSQLVLPDAEEAQAVEVCSQCLEVGITLARVARERIHEKRATQRRQELESLVEDQRGMVEQIHKIRFPSNGSDA